MLKGTEYFGGAYHDDVIVKSSSFPDHLAHLQDANLLVRPDMCQLGDAKFVYIGHLPFLPPSNSMQPLQNKVDAIQGFPKPQTKKIGLLVYWGLTPQQQPGSYQGGEMMMMKSVYWWRKPEYPEETTDLPHSRAS